MFTLRQLAVCGALGAVAIVALGSEAPSSGATAGTKDACAPWSGSGSPAASIEELFDSAKFEGIGRGLGMKVKCHQAQDRFGNKSLDCDLEDGRWSFDVEVEYFQREEEAAARAGDPWVRAAYARQGHWVLEVEVEHGPCAQAVLDLLLPKNQSLVGVTQAQLTSVMEREGWSFGETGCELVTFEGERLMDCYLVIGPALTADLSLSYQLAGGAEVDETRTLDNAWAFLKQAHGDASCGVHDGDSARAMLGVLFGG